MSSKQKSVLVTGGAGFIGSHLCERLVADGHKVISLDNYFTGSTDNHVDGVEYLEGETKDIESCVPETPDMVYHLGEYSRVLTSFDDIETVWRLNVAGTFAVLEFCRARGCRLVYAGSSTKFGEFDEGEDGKNQTPYAYFKATNTDLVNNCGAWFGLDYATTYFYNVYGPREIRQGPYATVIGIFADQFRRGEPLTVVAPGTQRRAFTHVKDTVEGLVLVGEKGKGDGYCIGADEEYAIREVAKMFSGEIEELPARRGDRTYSKMDTSKMRELGWEPQKNLKEYIEKIKELK